MAEWQPIETAPRDGTCIWIFGGILEGEISRGWANDEGTKAYCSGGHGLPEWILPDTVGYQVVCHDPTHWMPIPAPPPPLP